MNIMKKIVMMCLLAAATQQISAEGIKTAGDGKNYTLNLLSQIYSDVVDKYVDEDDGEIIYSLYEDVTIAAGDSFTMEDDVTVLFDDKVTLTIEGEADFHLTKGSTFDSAYDDYDGVEPVGIVMNNEQSQTLFQNCTFYYVGLRNMSTKGLKVDNCAFHYNNGAIGQAALTIGADGAPFEITNSTFSYNKKAAIAGAANFHNPLLIEDCEFYANGQANGNIPQINLTVADNIVVRRCTIEGDTELTMVGGIGISNFYAIADTHATIADCTISNNRYGIGTVGPVDISIEDNTLTDNHYELNPMNGGSGISFYDPYAKTTARVSGNLIEGSLWGITVIGCKDVNIGRIDVDPASPDYNPGNNIFKNNGNSGALYDLYNNSTNTIYAQGNTWNVSQQTEEQIETVIFHKHDDASLGTVIFIPVAQPTSISTQSMFKGQPTTENEIYDLHGRRIIHPAKGLYFERSAKGCQLRHFRF